MVHHKKAKKEEIKEKLRLKKKENKQKVRKKKARLVVHNLPFAVTEENLQEHFGKYGDIDEVKILKKEDGKKIGCAFVQYKLVQKASKAKHHLNNQPFMGRNISVDFALAANQYKGRIKTEIKTEPDVKEEPLDVAVKEEPIDLDEIKEESGDESDSGDEIADSESDKVKKKNLPDDVAEGKTVFVKNVPFSATNKDLFDCMKQFGPLKYALICVDKFTEHSKGTGFVKYIEKEDAQKALEAGTELKLLGNILDCSPALNRNDIKNKKEVKLQEKKGTKDSRNLYLVKEGVIMAGSKSAEGVSPSDMAKRLQLEQYKTQMLKNLNMFVSRERIVVHNLPSSWDDKKLLLLCKKFAGKGAYVREAKVMRDMRNVDASGMGKSKEFGFVTLNNHENALTLLRNLNNNPDIFTKMRRPIVTFSIEKKSAVKAKLKRLQVSRFKNPLSKDYDAKLAQESQSDASGKEFSGVLAKPGVIQKMRNRYKLTNQAKLHYENVKKEKRKKKAVKKDLNAKKVDFIRQEKQKIVKKMQSKDNLSRIESAYKKNIRDVPTVKKKKWYT